MTDRPEPLDIVSKTKRRLILADLRPIADDGPVPWDDFLRLASRHQLRPGFLRDLAIQWGIAVAPVPLAEKPSVVQRSVPTDSPFVIRPKDEPLLTLTSAEMAALRSGSLYRRLSASEPGEDPRDVFVLTRLSVWEKERRAINVLLDIALKGTTP